MKTVFAFLLLSLTLNVFAANSIAEILVDESVPVLSSQQVEEAKAAADCSAYTACPNGGYISCSAYGAGCTWYVEPYRYVSCTGYNAYGQWVNASYRCY